MSYGLVIAQGEVANVVLRTDWRREAHHVALVRRQRKQAFAQPSPFPGIWHRYQGPERKDDRRAHIEVYADAQQARDY